VSDGQLWCCIYGEALPGEEAVYGFALSEGELQAQLDQRRMEGYCPLSVVPYPADGELRYMATFRRCAPSSVWEVHRGLTATELSAAAAQFTAQGLTPSSVSVCAWDGTPRYCCVAMHEPDSPR
jgi:hypothetical protein